MAPKKRTANIELLRSVAMAMIVVMHFLARSDSLVELTAPITVIRTAGTLLEMFCIAAVNVYVLISGYFGIEGQYRPGRVLSMLCRIWFYALLIPAVLALMGIPTVWQEQGVYGLVQYIFPIEMEHYWFATSYVMLYLLSPFLNKAVRSMTQKQFRAALLGLLILFSGIKSISPVVFAFDKFGYDLPWFICVYLVGGYLKLYGGEWPKKKGWLIYAGSSLCGFGINLAMWYLAQRWDSFSYYFTVPFHYNYIFCLTGAIGLFYGFAGISVREGRAADRIRRMGSLCFGVYLLHEHVDIRAGWYGLLHAWINPSDSGALWLLFELIGCTLILFTAGIFIDWIRSLLFGAVAAVFEKTWLRQKVKELDQTFREG